MTDDASTPDTVTEAVALLIRLGYTDDLRLDRRGVADPTDRVEPADAAVVDHVYRFEGPSDPADEAIVLGVQCPTIGTRGVIVAGFGPSADAHDEEVLRALLR